MFKSVSVLRDDGIEPYTLFKKQPNHTHETMI